MKTFTIFILIMICAAMKTFGQTPPVEAGVSQTLARWRAANYSDVRYKLNLTLEKGAPLMKGEIEVYVKLTEAAAKEELILDWRTTQFQTDKDKPTLDVIQVNESVIKELPLSGNYDYRIDKEHLFIAPRHLKAGENFIKIQFASPIKTSGAAITRYVDKEDGAEYVYSLFVPSDASTAFPVFDQPDLKARFQLNIDIPAKWVVVNNSAEEDYAGGYEDSNGTRREFRHFETTKPISTYVFAFAAGEFNEFRGESKIDAKYPPDFNESLDTRSVALSRVSVTNIYVRKSQAEKFKAHEKEVFRLNREGVKFLETYFDYKFPFPKYDIVLIPEFPFGGMEHAGATFLREDRVIFPTEPTKNDLVTRANVIFHEAAHQWFGDTVTMRWFDDLWLKEGFAEFMAYKTLEKVMPEYNAWKIFYERNKQAAYLTDATRGTTPIYQEIPNLSAAKSAYGNIVYRKAPSFLKQAEFYLGEKEFQTAVRAFLKKHQFANAEWTDLLKEFEKNSINVFWKKSGFTDAEWAKLEKDFEKDSNGKLNDFATFWVKQRGLYKIRLNEHISTANPTYGIDAQVRHNLEDDRKFDGSSILMKFKVLIGTPDGKRIEEKYALYRSGAYSILERPKETSFIFPNYQDYGYGIFLLDEKSRAYILANIQTEKDDFLRTMMWGALWDSVREGELNPKNYVELVIKNLNVETDESTIQTLLGRVSTAMNYYLTDKQHEDLAPQIEATLTQKMQNAPTLGQRITFFRAFLNMGSSANARKILKDIRSGKLKIKDLDLKLKDRYDILTRLGILDDKDAKKEIYEQFVSRYIDIKSDEERRYAFASGAGLFDAEVKKYYFDNFINNKEFPESWIELAFVAFNSPRHSELTLPYLEKSLAELPNLKRNRKIFFVNGWLAAFIGGQRSEEALKIVNKFLADNANLDKDLRLKILENSDNLERAVKIRAKYGN